MVLKCFLDTEHDPDDLSKVLLDSPDPEGARRRIWLLVCLRETERERPEKEQRESEQEREGA